MASITKVINVGHDQHIAMDVFSSEMVRITFFQPDDDMGRYLMVPAVEFDQMLNQLESFVHCGFLPHDALSSRGRLTSMFDQLYSEMAAQDAIRQEEFLLAREAKQRQAFKSICLGFAVLGFISGLLFSLFFC